MRDSFIYQATEAYGGYSTASEVYVGGIAGSVSKSGIIENCYNTGTVKAAGGSSFRSEAGGIVGATADSGTVENCYNTGYIYADQSNWQKNNYACGCFAGGIVGAASQLTVSNCYNLGYVTSQNKYNQGSAAGIINGTGCSNCYNTGTINILVNEDNLSNKRPTAYAISPSASNSYYLTGCLSARASGYQGDSDSNSRDEAAFTDGTVAGLLGDAFTSLEGVNGNYPVLASIGSQTVSAWETPSISPGVNPVATAEVDKTASADYQIDLDGIFTNTNPTYKVSIDGGAYQTMGNAVYSGILTGDDTVLAFTANAGYFDGDVYTVIVIAKDAALSGARGELIGACRAAAVLSSSEYYVTDDRWNGETAYTGLYGGFWGELQNTLGEAGTLVVASGTDDTYLAMAEKLEADTGNVISVGNVNATMLYDAIQNAGGKTESDYTASTWVTFADALKAANTLTNMLYTDGKPTGTNTAARQPEVQSTAENLEAATSNLYLASAYTEQYNTYVESINEAKKLITLYDPAGMTETDYTSVSWSAFVAAYELLKTDTEYKVVGGSAEDREILTNFSTHLSALKTAYKSLVSQGDITVSFRYVNNKLSRDSAATGTFVYENEALALTDGNTTVSNAIKAAGILFSGSSNPDLLVYVNGICDTGIRTFSQLQYNCDIQLHKDDEVVVTWVPKPQAEYEYSSGYDSTAVSTASASQESEYRDSEALTTVTVPTGTIKVGDKVVIGAEVTAAYTTNAGDELSAENMTLFVSDPSQTEQMSAPGNKTAIMTDAEGQAEYVFAEPGWYTVALFNLTDDDLTFTSVYNVTTIGTYYSLYTGGFAIIHVEPADNEAALLVNYRKEKLAEAKAYYDGFHDYDFADGYYTETFTAQYNTLVGNLYDAETLKDLLTQYSLDYLQLQTYGKTAYDHAARVAAVRGYLTYIPDDLTVIDYSYRTTLISLAGRYRKLNDYEKTFFTPLETALIENVLSLYDTEAYMVYPAEVTVDVQLDFSSITLAPSYGFTSTAPNQNCVYTVCPSGALSRTYYTYTTGTGEEPSDSGMTAYLGNQINVRRLINLSDTSYWLEYSADNGETWTLMENQGFDASNEVLFNADYVIPADFDGQTLTIKVKGIPESEYEAILLAQEAANLADAKVSAKAALQATFDAYDLSEYDEAGKTALNTALSSGLSAIDLASTADAVAEARRAALAAMSLVKPVSSDDPDGTASFDSGEIVGRAYVTVENTTYMDGPFPGTILSGWYDLGENDSMMTMVLKALEMNGYTWNTGSSTSSSPAGHDYSISYLAGIFKDGKELSQFDGGPMSGWMGTLNDWFTNEGFAAFTYENGGIENNDQLCIMYTCGYGEDLGGTWYNADTSLKNLTISGGTLTPSFSSDRTDYSLILPQSKISVKVTPTAANKNYLVKTFLNIYNKDSAFYRRTETISVKTGDVLYIGVGESGWPTMNSGGEPTQYTVHIYTLEAALASLPTADSLTIKNYSYYSQMIGQLRSMVKSTQYTGDVSGLAAVEEKIEFFTQIDNVKSLLASIPAADKLTVSDKSKVQKASDAFTALTEEQKEYITTADVLKYNAAVEWLTAQGVAAPETISGSETASGSSVIEQQATVSGNTATAVIAEESLTSAVEAAKQSGTSTITISPTNTGSATDICIDIPKASAKSAADESMSLSIETGKGNVIIPHDTLSQLISAASGSNLQIRIQQKSASDVADPDIDTANAIIAEVTITSGGSAITTFGGESLTVQIPVDSTYTEDVSYQVIVISADGTSDTAVGKCIRKDGGLFVAVCTGHLSTFIVTGQKELPFTDVSGHWALEGINYAYENGLFAGTSDTAFSPNMSMTRAMLVTALYRMEGKPEITETNSFTDVESGQWYTDAVLWANANHIVSGYGNGRFGTNDSVTREQTAAILYRYAQYKKYDIGETGDLSAYTDAESIAPYALAAMQWANAEGIITGRSGAALAPDGCTTRAEIALILMRFCKTIGK